MIKGRAITNDGIDISESLDLKSIYPRTLLSQVEHTVLLNTLGSIFLTFYVGNKPVLSQEFSEDVGENNLSNISGFQVDELLFLQQDSILFHENKNLSLVKNLIDEYKVYYQRLYSDPLDFLKGLLDDLNIGCKDCKFQGSFFEITEYIQNNVKVKLRKNGYRRMFSIDYIFSKNDKLILNISLTVNNLENKVKYWLRFYDSDKHNTVILSCQISQNRKRFIENYPYLMFILDLIHQ